MDIWVWLGTSYIEWGSHALDKLLFLFSLSFLSLTYYISTHNSGWGKGDRNLRVQYLPPYSQVQVLIYSFEGVGERKYIQYSELTSDYKLPFNILKLSGRSIWSSTAFGQCQKWQMERTWGWWGLLAGGLEMLTQVAEYGKRHPT